MSRLNSGTGRLPAELRRIRLTHDITARALAQRIGVSPCVLSRWEHGGGLTVFMLIAWAAALQLDLTLCPKPIKPSTNQPSLNEASPILHSYRALRSNTPALRRRPAHEG